MLSIHLETWTEGKGNHYCRRDDRSSQAVLDPDPLLSREEKLAAASFSRIPKYRLCARLPSRVQYNRFVRRNTVRI